MVWAMMGSSSSLAGVIARSGKALRWGPSGPSPAGLRGQFFPARWSVFGLLDED
jgi:hypothetical protein